MKTLPWIGLGIVVVIALVVFGLAVGWALWGRQRLFVYLVVQRFVQRSMPYSTLV